MATVTVERTGPLTAGEARDLRARMCGAKVPMGQRAARECAARMRGQGSRVSAYPCPFHGREAWHVGHPPGLHGMQVLARYLRFGVEGG